MVVLVRDYMLQNQLAVSPMKTKVCWESVAKFYPLMVKRVPPLMLPVLGETEMTETL